MLNLANHLALSKHASLIVWELDQNRIYTSSVGGGLAVLGLAPNDIVGKRHSELHAHDNEALANVDRAYRGEEFTAEAVVNGRTFSTSYIPRVDATGKTIGLMAVSIDITEEKKKEKILQTEREQLDTIFNLSPSFMAILIGKKHIFQKANERYLDLIGHRNIIGLPLTEALPEIKDQGFDKILAEVLTTGKPYIGKEVQVKLMRNGVNEQRYLDFIYQQLKDENGNPVGRLRPRR